MLILARHGRTTTNADGRLLGRADPPLDPVGRAQATAMAAAVDGASLVVSSPLRRARETAAALGLPVSVDDRWIELDYGELDGRRIADVPADLWAGWRADVAWRPPGGGESLVDLGRRIRAACEELADDVAETDVVVVSHVSPIKAALAWALGVGDEVAWRIHLAPASICRVAVRRTGPVVLSVGEVAHLPPQPDRSGP